MLVLLDNDGVLVDSELLSNRVLAETLATVGVEMTTEESIATFMGNAWSRCEELIAERLGGPVPPTFADAYHERLFRAVDEHLDPVPGILAAIDELELAGHRTAVASNGHRERIERMLGRTGLLHRFEGRIFSGAEVARPKPAPDLFLHTAAAMGFAPADTVVVEDSATGVAAARAAGMRVVAYAAMTPAEQLADADAVLTDMWDLPAVIRGFARG